MSTFDTIWRTIAALIIVFSSAEAYPRPIDCQTTATTNGNGMVKYLGCRHLVRTDSLTKPKTPKKSIYAFKGIPFAEPPVGSLRFRKPVAKIWPKKNILWDARRYRKPCMQPWIVDFPFFNWSEDCLYLNIWTPRVDNTANLPVMFWIYGGAFTVGSGSQFAGLFLSSDNIFVGTKLALRDVVVVTINYRLGVFGFLYGNRSDCPGNQGFWDQALALQWVKDNIRAFGGNPNQITLFGESAGSISISNHMVSNITRHLFQRAIMQSGSAYIKLMSREPEYAYGVARKFAKNDRLFWTGGCGHTEDWIECLRKKSAQELLFAMITSVFFNPSKPWYTVWIQQFCPIFGDEFVPININKAVKTGNFRKDIKVLLGHNEMEGLFFTTAFDIMLNLRGRYNPLVSDPDHISTDIVSNDIRSVFFDNDTIGIDIADQFTNSFHKDVRQLDKNGLRRSAVYAFGNYFLTCPTILFGAHVASNPEFTGEIYQYRLTYSHKHSFTRLSSWAEVTHTDDIALVFGNPFTDRNLWTDGDRRLSKEMMDIWTHFAINDEMPIVNGNRWPKYNIMPSYGHGLAVNVSYLELHADSDRLGRVWTNRYKEDPTQNPKWIGDCFYLWDAILSEQFEVDLEVRAREQRHQRARAQKPRPRG